MEMLSENTSKSYGRGSIAWRDQKKMPGKVVRAKIVDILDRCIV